MARVLVVEDDDSLRNVLKLLLARAEHDPVAVSGGHEALEVLDDSFDLVLTDINMPEMDGIELIMEIRERTPQVGVIAMSGGGFVPKQLLLSNAGALGAHETITKPFDPPDLIEAVERVLSRQD